MVTERQITRMRFFESMVKFGSEVSPKLILISGLFCAGAPVFLVRVARAVSCGAGALADLDPVCGSFKEKSKKGQGTEKTNGEIGQATAAAKRAEAEAKKAREEAERAKGELEKLKKGAGDNKTKQNVIVTARSGDGIIRMIKRHKLCFRYGEQGAINLQKELEIRGVVLQPGNKIAFGIDASGCVEGITFNYGGRVIHATFAGDFNDISVNVSFPTAMMGGYPPWNRS